MDTLLFNLIIYVLTISSAHAVVRSVLKVKPNAGSLNGATKLTIDGSGFSLNQVDEGNVVRLVSQTKIYDCPILEDSTTELQILCITKKMDPDDYYVRVQVDGEPIPLNYHCGGNPFHKNCRFTPHKDNTPSITAIVPRSQSAPPGEIIEVHGKIMSGRYGSNVPSDEVLNRVPEQILRIYAGYQLCKIKGENDFVYGIVLRNEGTSKEGYIRCKMMGTFIGYSNASIIVDGHYGRTLPDMMTLKVAHNDIIYMIQNYAEVSGISHSVGSINGGLSISINGNNFGVSDEVKVMIADSECVVQSVTPDEIVCITPAQTTLSAYPGGRGITLERWNQTQRSFSDLAQVSDFTGLEDDYTIRHIDDLYLEEDTQDSVYRLKGFIKAPHDGEYVILVKGNKATRVYLSHGTVDNKNPANKVELVTNPSTSSNFRSSSRITLQQGHYYYIEVVHQVSSGTAKLQVALKHLNTLILHTMTGFSKSEKQKLSFTSTVVREKQRITAAGFSATAPVHEIQLVTILEAAGLSNAMFQLGLYGVYTEPLTTASNAATIQAKLMDLPFLHTTESFHVAVASPVAPDVGVVLTITFQSSRGQFPLMLYKTKPSTDGADLAVTVVRNTVGVPGGDFVAIEHEGVPAPLFTPTASRAEVENAFRIMYGTRCSKKMRSPEGGKRFYDYESSIPEDVGGSRTNKVEPFCGKSVIRNPSYLFRDVTENSNGFLISTGLFMVCFAYQGGQIQDKIRLGYTYENTEGELHTANLDVSVVFEQEQKWHYFCLNMQEKLNERHAMSNQPAAINFYIREIRVFKLGTVLEYFIDDVLLGRKPPVPNIEDIDCYRMQPSKPNGALIESVIVTSSSAGVYDITLVPHECGNNFPLYTPVTGQLTSVATVEVVRIDTASPPLTGTFKVIFGGEESPDFPFDIDESILSTELEAIPGMGIVGIKRYGDCARFYYTITYLTLPGDVEQIQIDGSDIDGVGVTVVSQTIEDGGLFYDPIPGDILRTFHTNPQVFVSVNDVPSLCTGNCTFMWSVDKTPTFTSRSPCCGNGDHLLKLTGTGFDTTAENNVITIGDISCTTLNVSADGTTIFCSPGMGPAGLTFIKVNVADRGYATGTIIYIFFFDIISWSPLRVGLGGGIPFYGKGVGFDRNDFEILIGGSNGGVGGVTCEIQEINSTNCKCILPAMAEGSYSITSVYNGGHNSHTYIDNIVYDVSITPIITTVNPATEGAAGGSPLTITGTEFGTSGTLFIGDTEVEATFTDTEISAILPSLPADTYKIYVIKDNIGGGVLSNGQLPTITYQLKVTNVFPLTGSMFGGTRVTLTGDGFSTNAADISVMVGDTECDVESTGPTQIICVIQSIGKDVAITNQGTHKIFGIGFQWYPYVAIATVGDVIKWTWTTPSYFQDFRPNVVQRLNASTVERPFDGFIGEPRPNGRFEYKVTKSGKIHYNSGFIDSYENIQYSAIVYVQDKNQSIGDVTLKVKEHEAVYDVNSGISNPTPPAVCGETTSPITGCTDQSPTGGAADKFSFLFQTCSTPIVDTFSITEGTTADEITIDGLGFSTVNCQNKVTIGDDVCTVTASTNQQIKCSLDAANSPMIGVRQTFGVGVGNLGTALIRETGQDARTFVLKPMISDLSPSVLSINGGAVLVITGSGFQGNESSINVYVDRQPNMLGVNLCDVQSVTYTQITCITPQLLVGSKLVEVEVLIKGFLNQAVCKKLPNCEVEYKLASTPEFTNVSPDTLDGTLTTLTITGNGFGSISNNIMVKIGGIECIVSSVTEQQIKCDISNVPVGVQAIMVTNKIKGHATNTNNKQITSTAKIIGIIPTEGSTNGGTIIEIAGNGFGDGTTVTIGGNTCEITSVTLSLVKCKSPAHTAEAGVTIVVMSSGITYQPQQTFDYAISATPQITSTTFQSQSGTIHINGNGFSSDLSKNTVTVGSADCNIISSDATSIQCTAPDLMVGPHAVVIHVEGKGLSNNDKTVTYVLSLTSINPVTGSSGGGQTITFTGSGFDNTTIASICDKTCERIDSASQTALELICLVPQASGIPSSTLVCAAKVTSNLEMDQLTNSYTYDASLTPTISSVSPPRGGTGGGVTLTINGLGFGNVVGNVTVTIAGTPCVVSSVIDTQIICETGAHSPSQMAKVKVEIDQNGIALEESEGKADFLYVDVWSSQYSWGGNPPPEDGTLVVIGPGQTIVLDTKTAKLKMLLIKGGSLIFDEKEVELIADNILITEGGLLQVGTEDEPFNSKATITLTGHHRTKELPIYGTKSLGVRNGILDLHGKPVDIVWTKLAATAVAGSSEIKVQDSVTWTNGDKIIIASTGPANSVVQNELHTVVSVAVDGVTITINGTLQFDHLGVMETVESHSLEYRAEVGMLTRNIVIQGDRDPQWDVKIEACPAGFDVGEFATQTCFQGRHGEEMGSDQFGGQVMLHPPIRDQNLAVGRVSFVEFYHVGQAFRLGRYPFHVHLAGNSNASYIKGCGIHNTFNRAVNIHGSHYVLVENNVAYNVMGGSIFLEDGVETGNIIKHNLVVGTRESSSLLNDDVTPAAFWITNPSNIVVDNAAAGGSHFGFWYRLEATPRGPSFTTDVNPNHEMMGPGVGTFKGNTAHSLGWFGLWIFEMYFPRDNGLRSGEPNAVVFEKFTAWNCEKGAELVNGGAVQFKDFKMIHNPVGVEIKMIKEGDYYNTTGPLLMNTLILGSTGVLGSISSPVGVVLPLANRYLIDGVEFREFTQQGSAAFKFAKITGTSGPNNGGFTYHTRSLQFVNVGPNHKGIYEWEFQGVLKDLDGTLIEDPSKSGWWILPKSDIFPSSPTCEDYPGFTHPQNAQAIMCDPTKIKFHRFSFNNAKPSSLEFKDFEVTISNGNMSASPWEKKRITHKKGYMVVLASKQNYDFAFKSAEHMTNISFDGTFDSFEEGDWLTFTLKVAQKPDCVVQDNICVNETEGELDGTLHFFGDWTYSPNDGRITYLVSLRDRNDARKKRDVHVGPLYKEINLKFKLYKCAYKDCILPDPNSVPLVDARPGDAVFWSNPNSWPNDTVPESGDCVTIEEGVWMVANTTIPDLCELILHGVLELEADDGQGGVNSFVIKTPRIIITKAGRFIAGFNKDQPFMGNLHIILQGSHSSPNYILEPDSRDLGSKVIGVFGGLDLNGKHITHSWVRLAADANIGDQTITVNEEVGWVVENEIVVTPTGYSAWETETFKITNVNAGGGQTVLMLNDTLRFKHLAQEETINGKTYAVIAEVGLLSRNIIVEGEDYPNLYKESYGGRILVGASSNGIGFSRLSNVEFYHMGQEGYVDTYDPRYVVSFVDTGGITANRPSYVVFNAFYHCFSPAIGVYNMADLKIEDNVIHHTIYWAIQTNSANTQIRRNLVTLNLFPGTYQDRLEDSNTDHDGVISAMEANNLVLENNAVSGGERVCYHVTPQSCDAVSGLYTGNIARTCLIGVAVVPTDKVSGSCVKFAGFTTVKCPYFGIYYNSGPSLNISNVCIGDSAVGVFPMVIGPSATSHAFADKYVSITDSLIIGKSSAFDCASDVLDTSDQNIRLARTSRPSDINKRIGTVTGQFTSGSNMCAEKPCVNIMAYQAIKGVTVITDVTFANFTEECAHRGAAIASNQKNEDGQHPVEVERLTFVDVPVANRVFYDRPGLGTINSADCVDMNCDGLKKNLIRDNDGSLLGAIGAVIPKSEFEWDGDARRGLGNYRIPKSMLTTTSGLVIDPDVLALYKGVVRNQTCQYRAAWQAYECLDLDYQMLIIESMDDDTEIRRISPVAILGYDDDRNGYIDLINGPQDHGWCSGYTCRKRLSTFQALVITGKGYIIHFTGTTPQHMRYFLLNTQDTVLLSVWYSQPFRLDVYLDGIHKLPTNGEWKTVNGQQVYNLLPATTVNQYLPVPSDPVGTSWFDRDDGMLYVVVGGSSPVEVKTQPAVIVSFKYPPLTLDEFYGERCVEYLAEFFNLPPHKVRMVQIVSASSGSGRRKRSTGEDVLVIEISNEPSYEINGTVQNELTWDDLLKIYALAVDEGQLGNFSYILDGQVIGVSVAKPITPNDPLWAAITVSTLGGAYKILVHVDRLAIHQHITPTYEGLPFITQPKIKVLDTYGNRISDLGTPAYPWYVTATLRGGNPSAVLIGNTTVQFVDGWANFTNLGINYFGSDYIIDFNISSPAQGENYTVMSDPLTIPSRRINAVVVETTTEIYEQTAISVSLELRDSVTGMVIEDIKWRNHVWNVDAELGKPDLYEGILSGTTTVVFDSADSRASFSSLQVSTYGIYIIKYHITSTPADYDFYVEHSIIARGQHHRTMPMNQTAEIKLRLTENYQTVVGSGANYITSYLGTWFGHMFSDIEVLSASVLPGSIILTLTVNGTSMALNDTLFSVCDIITNGTSGLSYNGHDLTMAKYMTYDGSTFYGVKCGDKVSDDDDEFPLAIIIASSMVGLALLVILIFCILWKCKVYPKTKTADLRHNSYYGDIDDILFREKSFMSITSKGGLVAPMSTNLHNGYKKRRTPDIFQ